MPVSIGIGLNIDRGASVPIPTGLSGTLALWLSARATTLYDSSNVVCTNGVGVKTWLRPGDSIGAPAFNRGVQTTAGDQPICAIASGAYAVQAVSADFLTLNTALALTADFTAWFVGKRSAGQILTFLGKSGAVADAVVLYSDNNFYVQSAATTTTLAFSGTNGVTVAYRVRRIGNQLYLNATGIVNTPMVTLNLDTINLDQVHGRTLGATFSDNGTQLNEIVVMTGTAVAADDNLMAAYLLNQWNVALT